jgi:hypothetical protein
MPHGTRSNGKRHHGYRVAINFGMRDKHIANFVIYLRCSATYFYFNVFSHCFQ